MKQNSPIISDLWEGIKVNVCVQKNKLTFAHPQLCSRKSHTGSGYFNKLTQRKQQRGGWGDAGSTKMSVYIFHRRITYKSMYKAKYTNHPLCYLLYHLLTSIIDHCLMSSSNAWVIINQCAWERCLHTKYKAFSFLVSNTNSIQQVETIHHWRAKLSLIRVHMYVYICRYTQVDWLWWSMSDKISSRHKGGQHVFGLFKQNTTMQGTDHNNMVL